MKYQTSTQVSYFVSEPELFRIEWIFDEHSNQIWLSTEYVTTTTVQGGDPAIRPHNSIMLDIFSEAHSPAEGWCWHPTVMECLEGDRQQGQASRLASAGPHGGWPCEHCLWGQRGLPRDAVQLGAPCSDQWCDWQQQQCLQTQSWQRIPGEKRPSVKLCCYERCVDGGPRQHDQTHYRKRCNFCGILTMLDCIVFLTGAVLNDNCCEVDWSDHSSQDWQVWQWRRNDNCSTNQFCSNIYTCNGENSGEGVVGCLARQLESNCWSELVQIIHSTPITPPIVKVWAGEHLHTPCLSYLSQQSWFGTDKALA